MQLDDLQVPMATRMNFTLACLNKEPQSCAAQFLGYRRDHSLLAFIPKRPVFPLRKEMGVDVRLGLQSAIVRFASSILEASERPYLYVHLVYPAEVVIEKQLRKSPRFTFNHPATCVAQGSSSTIIACVFVDISLSGARLEFGERLPASTSRIRVCFSTQIANSDHKIEIEVFIKSAPEETAVAPFTYGVSFAEITVQQQLLLEAMCFELQERKP